MGTLRTRWISKCIMGGYLLLMAACTGNPIYIPATVESIPSIAVDNRTPPISSNSITSSRSTEIPKVNQPTLISITTLTASVPNPTVTRRPTPTVTPTPLPTVPPDQVPAIIAELDQNGGNCTLPCWWGMTPGKSRWDEHEPFLLSIAEVTKESWYDPSVVYYNIHPNLLETDHYIINGGVVGVLDGVVASIDTGGTSDVPQLRLPEFLLTNGKPDEVWISTFSSVPEGKPPFRLFLVYRNGVIAKFEQSSVPIIDDKLTSCFQTPYSVFLLLVAPEQPYTFAQALESGRFTTEHRYLSLEEATGLNIDTFYEDFSNTSNPLCLQTHQHQDVNMKAVAWGHLPVITCGKSQINS